jgi:hypothetical protein
MDSRRTVAGMLVNCRFTGFEHVTIGTKRVPAGLTEMTSPGGGRSGCYNRVQTEVF